MTDSVIFGMKLDDLQICQNALNENFKGKSFKDKSFKFRTKIALFSYLVMEFEAASDLPKSKFLCKTKNF